jgi:hypothetical protein
MPDLAFLEELRVKGTKTTRIRHLVAFGLVPRSSPGVPIYGLPVTTMLASLTEAHLWIGRFQVCPWLPWDHCLSSSFLESTWRFECQPLAWRGQR